MKFRMIAIVSVVIVFSGYTAAHHSFAIYDVYNDPIEFSGVVQSWQYRNPHSILQFKVDAEHGGCVWTMEVRNRIWDRMELPRDLIEADDEMIVMLWRARDSSPEALMGAFEIKGQERVVLQTSATGNSDPPTNTVTITRPVCED